MNNKGIIIGLSLILIHINLNYGLPIFLFIILLLSNKIKKKHLSDSLTLLLFLFIFWNLLNVLIFDKNISHGILYSLGAFFLLFFKYNRFNIKTIEGLNKIINILLVIDLIFNISIFYTGVDFLGRSALTRETDVLTRSGGIFNHPFLSFNISVISLMANMPKRNKKMILLGLINIILNGTGRGLLFVVQFFLFLFLVQRKFRFSIIIIASFLFAIFVYLITITSSLEGNISSNIFRVYAWSNSVNNIIQNPFWGKLYFDFSSDLVSNSISLDIIEDQGISESTYLEIGSHYGVIPMILLFVILYKLLKISFHEFHFVKNNLKETILLFTLIVFCDTFYGSIFGTVISTCYFAMLFFHEGEDSTVINNLDG